MCKNKKKKEKMKRLEKEFWLNPVFYYRDDFTIISVVLSFISDS